MFLFRLKNKIAFVVFWLDFNLPSLSWRHSDDTNVISPSCSNEFVHSLIDLSLSQINTVFYFHNQLFDLVFVSDYANPTISRISPLYPPKDLYHPTLEILLKILTPINSTAPETEPKSTRCFRKANYADMNNLLSQVDWSFIDYIFSPHTI